MKLGQKPRHWPPDDACPTLRSVAEHPQFRALWAPSIAEIELRFRVEGGGFRVEGFGLGLRFRV